MNQALMPRLVFLALLCFSLSVTPVQIIAANDSTAVTYNLGPLYDLDGDGELDTLIVASQEVFVKGHHIKTRRLLAGIAWHSDTATDQDTTLIELPRGRHYSSGVRVVDLDNDGILDVECSLRRVKDDTKSKAQNEKDFRSKKSDERVYVIHGGTDLRSQRTIALTDLKSKTVPSGVTDRTASARSDESLAGIGPYSIRRIYNRAAMQKVPIRPVVDSHDTTQIHVFPNPAKDHINIDVSSSLIGSHLSIVDVNGRQMIKPLVLVNESMALNITQLASGQYTLSLVQCADCPISITFVVAR